MPTKRRKASSIEESANPVKTSPAASPEGSPTQMKRKQASPPAGAPTATKRRKTATRRASGEPGTGGASRLERLPPELFAQVVCELPEPEDLVRLGSASRTLRAPFDAADRSLWCRYLARWFDTKDSRGSANLFNNRLGVYRLLTRDAIWSDERGPWGRDNLHRALRYLVLNANTPSQVAGRLGTTKGNAFRTMELFVKTRGVFEELFRWSNLYESRTVDRSLTLPASMTPSLKRAGGARYLGGLVLTMLHLGLTPGNGLDKIRNAAILPDCKAACYQHPITSPLLLQDGDDPRELPTGRPSVLMRPNASTLLQIATFFRCYFLDASFNDQVADAFRQLPDRLRPGPWRHQLGSDVDPLAGTTHWKGCSVAVSDAHTLEKWRRKHVFLTCKLDKLNQSGMADDFAEYAIAHDFFDLRLELLDAESLFWHADYDDDLPLCAEAATRAPGSASAAGVFLSRNAAGAPLVGYGREGALTNVVTGHVHDLAETSGIRGWKHISYFTWTRARDAAHVSRRGLVQEARRLGPIAGKAHDRAVWAFDGVVPPGGNVIVGRWHLVDPGLPAEPARRFHRNTADGDVHPASRKEVLDHPLGVLSHQWAAQMEERTYTGPFIYWRVQPGSDGESEDEFGASTGSEAQ